MCQRCCHRKELRLLKGAFSFHLARLDQNSCSNSPGKPHWTSIWVLTIHSPLSSRAMLHEIWKGADEVSSVTCPGAINAGPLLVTMGSGTLITVLLGWLMVEYSQGPIKEAKLYIRDVTAQVNKPSSIFNKLWHIVLTLPWWVCRLFLEDGGCSQNISALLAHSPWSDPESWPLSPLEDWPC